MSRAVFGGLAAAAVGLALVLRLAGLDLRPMHHDEANQAVKFGALLETGQYLYDSNDHHGPTLYYLTLPSAWARGQATLASLDERTLRVVPALFGAGLVLLVASLAGVLGRQAAAAGALLAALSPALSYYSRSYIQESLFVFFALAFLSALGRWVTAPRAAWAAGAGLAAGLAHATKETSLIVLGAAAVAALVARRWTTAPRPAGRLAAHLVLGLGTALAVTFILYSSFFANPSGLLDSFRALGVYLERGIDPGPHGQRWDYYLRLLAWSASGGLVWTEGLILALAVVGLAAAAGRARAGFWPRYVALYTAFAALVFSLIRYKTPWNVLPFHVGFVLLAGLGASVLIDGARSRLVRGLLVLVLAAGALHLGAQSWRASFRYPADPRNPYVYAQTSPDFLRLVQRIADVSALHPDGTHMPVKVVAGPYEQWPLPWYLRRMDRVGYWTDAAGAGPLDLAPVIVASQEQAAAIDRALGDRYVSEFFGLRPDVLLTLYIDRTLWERFLRR